MNRTKRNRLSRIIDSLESLLSDVESIRDEEQRAFDNMPENLQDSSKGDAFEERIGQLDDAVDYLEDAIESLREAVI